MLKELELKALTRRLGKGKTISKQPRFGELMSEDRTKGILTRSNLRDLVLAASFISVLFCPVSDGIVIVGLLLLAAGCLLHLVTKGVLVRNVVLCQEGVYGMVRHPYYLANYSIDSSFCLLSGNVYLLLAYPFLFYWAYGPTMRNEEVYLAAHHGDVFQRHSATVPQIFPDRTSLSRWRGLFEDFSWKRISWNEYARVTRFCSLGIFISVLNAVHDEGLSGLMDIVRPRRNDWDEFLFGLCAVALWGVSVFLMRWARRVERPVDK